MRKLAMIVAGCAATAFTAAAAMPSLDLADWHASFDSEAHPGLHGELMTHENADQTVVMLKLTGAPPDAAFPWHIHEGPCGPGAIVGGASSYKPITAGADSIATATATIPVVLDESKQYHVNLHASAAEMDKIIGCGDLTR